MIAVDLPKSLEYSLANTVGGFFLRKKISPKPTGRNDLTLDVLQVNCSLNYLDKIKKM
jgi:hypothetical protein